MEYHYGEKAIMNRQEMFEYISRYHEGSEELKLQTEYLKKLTKPIYNELKQFCDDYYNVWVKYNNKAADSSFIYEKIAHRISHFVINNMSEEINREKDNPQTDR